MLALTPEDLHRYPHLYLQRLLTIPQLPPPKNNSLDQLLQSPGIPEQSLACPSEMVLADETVQHFAEPQYSTGWGCVTFSELYARTHRYASYLLKQKFHGSHEQIEDGLQVGYLKLWERLEKDPNLFAERQMGSVAKQVFYGALHTHHREHVHQKRYPSFSHLDRKEEGTKESEPIVIYTPTSHRPHSPESRQADQRMDLHAAIAATANHILALPAGRKQDRALWALYSMTMLHVHVTEASQLFRVDGKAMKQAYEDVRQLLQHSLENYAPKYPTRPVHNKGQKTLPYQDIREIRQQNEHATSEHFARVRQQLDEQHSDTYDRDVLALRGIQDRIPARQLAQIHQIPASAMQRAYERIHLLLGSCLSPIVSPRRPERKHNKPFVFMPEHATLIQTLAHELLTQSNNQVWVVALYAYLCNLPIRTTAQNFNLKESTLRRYRHTLQDRMTQLIEAHKTEAIALPLGNQEQSIPKQQISIPDVMAPAFSELPSQPEIGDPLYQTRWKGQMSFEDIFMDRDIRRVAFFKMRSLGYTNQDAEDCFQLGSLNLWKKLQEHSDLLSDKGAAWVGVWIALSGSRRALWKHNARSVVFDHSAQNKITRENDCETDNYLSGPPERYAGFATRVDERIDFALLMSGLAQRYESDPLKLFALYSLTTSVKMKDLLPVVGAHKNQFIQARQAVKQDLRELLEQDTERDVEDEFWRNAPHDQYEHVGRVAEQVMDNPHLLLALYVATTSAKRKDIIDLFKIGRTGFRKDIIRIKIMLAEESRKLKRLKPESNSEKLSLLTLLS